MPMMLTLGTVSIAVAGPGDGIFVNDGTDNGCSRVGDSGSMSGVTNAACTSSDKSTQTDHSLFYNPLGQVGLGATSLTLGNELFVNGGSTATLLAPVTAGAHINTLDMRGTKVLQLANGTVSATSQDAVNGAELFNTATSTATALGGGAQVTGTTGQISAPSYSTTTVNAAGNVTTATTSANVGDALTNLSTSLANSANVGVNYDDAATKARVTFNPTGAATTLANVAAGTLSATSTEAVNGTQLNATNTTVSAQGAQLSGMVNDGTGIKYFHSASTKGDSSATGLDSVAIGPLATAAGGGSISLGNGATTTATGGRAIALGNLSSAQSNGSVAIGSESTASGIDGLALGWQAQALTAGAVALGGEAAASGNNSVALGNNASATVANSMALGSFATTTAATATTNGVINGTTYNYAGTAPVGVLSVGNATQHRQITNVAAGEVSATSTNAINGSQLNATNTAVNALGAQDQQFTTALGGGAQLDPTTGAWVAPSYNTTTIDAAGNASAPATSNNVGAALTGMSNSLANTAAVGVKYDDASTKTSVTFNPGGTATTLSNVAAGTLSATSTDAVNGSQLNATNTSVTDLGTSLNTSITNLGNSFSTQLGNIINNGDGIKYFHSESSLGDSTATGLDSVAIGPVATASADNAIAMGNGANASIANSLALGNGATTAAATATASGVINGTTYNYAGTAPVGVLSVGAVGAERQISNVAAGRVSATSTDAVNGSQLNATNTSVTDLGTSLNTSITNLGNSFSTQLGNIINNGAGIKYFHSNSALGDSTATGTDSVAIGPVATASADNAIALGNGANASTANSLALGNGATTAAATATASGVINGTTYNYAGTAPVGVLSVGAVGAERQISNVAAGRVSATSTDAVNGSQLNATNTSVSDLSTNLSTQISNLANNAGNQMGQLGQGVSAAFGGGAQVDPTTGAMTAPSYSTTTIDTAGNATTATTSNNVGAALTGLSNSLANTAAVGVKYDDVNTKTSVTFNPGGTATTLSNVAAGTLSATSTDAVNGSQLNATNTSVTDLGTSLNTSITNLGNSFSTQLGNIVTNGAGIKYFHSNSALGDSTATGTDSVAIGPVATASADNAIALGNGANASIANSLALGNGATTAAATATASGVINGTTYNYAGTAPVGVLSVGAVGAERQISNVAAGQVSATSTDAVNGSQLNATNTSVTDLNTNVNTSVTNLSTQISNLANSAGNQIGQLGQSVSNALGGGAQVDPTTGAMTAPSFSTTTIDAAGNTTTATTSNNVGDALTGLSNSLANTAAVGVKYDNVSTKTRVTFNPGGTATTLSNVAAGSLSATSTDAVNGSQLFNTTAQLNNLIANSGSQNQYVVNALGGGAQVDPVTGAVTAPSFNTTTIDTAGNTTTATTSTNVGDALTSLSNSLANTAAVGVKYDDVNSKTRVTFNPGGAATTLTNVAAGSLSATSTDAVNGSQLFLTNNTVVGLTTQLNNIVNSGSSIKYFHASSSKADSLATGTDAMAVGPNAQASGTAAIAVGNETVASGSSSVALGDGAKATAAGSVAIGKGASDDQRGTETYTGKYSNASNTTAGVVSVGNATTGETRVVSNVADGSRATDAVNVRQLDGAVAESKAYTDTSLNQIQGSIKNVDGAIANVTSSVTKVEAAVTSVQNGTSGAFQVNNTRAAAQPKASGINAVAGGMGSQASGNNSMAVGSNTVASAENATATGNGAQATAQNSVALGANSVADRESSVSVGSAGGERQITNVAAGTRGTDAANIDQVSRGIMNANINSKAYTDQRFTDLKRNLKQQDDTLSAGIAGAMAMASLPRSSVAGGSMTSVAMGNYRGQSALAIGVSHVSENGRWSTNFMGTTSSQNDTGVAVGVGYQW
ncbi:YadA-like family protein [Pseudomonas sp. P9_2]|uniref:YadA-like family protein n=1 Tax=Pseudomonas sp. P9_2 TaxID=3043447 RepID=UPI002A366B40|nr:YadA-like family protein [Pseudomonas sp. P9_2]WPN52001.1 YadA-like family protein [Pseudomonas sp. P9_2]